MMEPQMLGPAASAVAFVATFSFALSVSPKATQTRLAASALFAALAYNSILGTQTDDREKHDLVRGYGSAIATIMFHVVDYLIVLRACSSDGSDIYVNSGWEKGTKARSISVLLNQYIWLPLSLLCNWRRIGTRWQISNNSPDSRSDRSYTPSRFALILQRIFCLILGLMAIDICSVNTLQDSALMNLESLRTPLNQLTKKELLFRINLVVRYYISAIMGVYVGYAFASIVGLTLFLTSPSNCPPMFGKLSDVYTVRGCWGEFYHQGLRRAISGPADKIVADVLGLRRGTLLSRYLRLLLAFSFSGVIHWISESTAGAPKSDRGHFWYFTSQAFAIMFEECVKYLYGRMLRRPLPLYLERLAGYCWVFAWHLHIGPYFAYSAVIHGDPKPSQLMAAFYEFSGLKNA